MADRRRERVMLAYPTGGHPDPRFVRSLAFFLVWDAKGPRRVVDGAYLQFQTTNLPHGRNQIVKRFLETDLDWLWFVDDDQSFPPDTLERLLASADPVERPILGALVFSFDAETDRVLPTIWSFGDGSPQRWTTFPPGRLVECGGTGTGCLLVHRSVFEKVAAARGESSWPWFQYGEWVSENGPDVFGEDLTFMARAHLGCGFPVFVDTRVEVGHVKSWTVDSRAHVGRTSVDELVPLTWVVVPVKDRLDLTKSLVRQLREQGGYDRLVILDNGSQRPTAEWLARQSDITTVPMPDAGIHEMWNRGAEVALASWPKANLIFLNNDLELGPDFCRHLAAGLRSGRWGAVCGRYDGREMSEPVEQVHGICANCYDGSGGLAGFAFAVRGEVFAAGYRFPEDAKWWFGDNDLCLTLDHSGVPYGVVRDATVVHLDGGGQTGDWESPEMQPQLRQDREAFVAKWGPILRAAS